MGLEDVSTGIAAARQRCLHTSLQSTEKGAETEPEWKKKSQRRHLHLMLYTNICVFLTGCDHEFIKFDIEKGKKKKKKTLVETYLAVKQV